MIYKSCQIPQILMMKVPLVVFVNEIATEITPCCYEYVCEAHYNELMHECEDCDSEICEICIEYGNMNGLLCYSIP